MGDIDIRKDGKTGRITLTRPQALNAMTYAMCTAIESAIDQWRDDDAVALVMIDAAGDRAFCAGGDIAELYETGTKGDFAFGQRFWRDEYRLNAKLAEYPKPIVTFLQGFVMGGGVGIGCHASQRVVGDSTRISMPECGIGLVPDVGGSYLLARAPGRMGEFLGLTGHRMGPGDAILAGFADFYMPETVWDDVKAQLIKDGDVTTLHSATATSSNLDQAAIDAHFGGVDLVSIINALRHSDSAFGAAQLKVLKQQNPLAMACALTIQHRLKAGVPTIRKALELEYRFTHRAIEHGDFLEGIRAQIIDKDRNPRWSHQMTAVPGTTVARMLQPLGKDTLQFEKDIA